MLLQAENTPFKESVWFYIVKFLNRALIHVKIDRIPNVLGDCSEN